jgi:hypothetical protein
MDRNTQHGGKRSVSTNFAGEPEFRTTLGIESGTTEPGKRGHLAFLGSLSFVAFIDSRKR